MAFTPEFLDELRARAPLAATIGRRLKLLKRGREYVALCPFHNEKTPSFTVNEDKGFFHCFGCQEHGDVIGFVMRADNLAFPEAVAKLAAEAGLALPVSGPEDREAEERRQSLYPVIEAASAWFEAQLQGEAGKGARAYLERRGLAGETIAEFGLGYAPAGGDALRQALSARGFGQEVMLEAGLLAAREDRAEVYGRFRDRIIFPIADRRGHVIAFGGRALSEKAQPKYLNSPDTPLFRKGRLLYNLARARAAAREAGTIVVAEGYMDVIALSAAGFKHAVAPLGTALTEAQLLELWRLAPEPVLCLDGDAAGRRAAYRAAERALPLLEAGHSLRFASLPNGEDPDSLIAKRGSQAMAELLERAAPLAEVLWTKEVTGARIDTPERRALLEQRLLRLCGEIRDETVGQYYRRHFKSRLWREFRDRRPGAGSRRRAGAGPRRHDGGRDRISDAGTLAAGPERLTRRREELLLLTLINHPAMIEHKVEALAEVELTNPELDGLRRELIDMAGRESALDSEDLRFHLSQRGFSESIDRLDDHDVSDLDWFAAEETALKDAETGWDHTLARHRRDVTLRAQWEAAEKAYGERPTPENGERLLALQKEIQEASGDEDELKDYGVASGREAGP